MKPVTLYTTQWCPYCIRAKALLDAKGATYREFRVDQKPELRAEMMRLSSQRTVPQIWIDDMHVGGCDELYALERAGDLDALLLEVPA